MSLTTNLKWKTTRVGLSLIALALISLTIVLTYACQSKARVALSETQNLVIEAFVEKIGAAPGVGSGGRAVFYIGEKPKLLSPDCAPCEPCE